MRRTVAGRCRRRIPGQCQPVVENRMPGRSPGHHHGLRKGLAQARRRDIAGGSIFHGAAIDHADHDPFVARTHRRLSLVLPHRQLLRAFHHAAYRPEVGAGRCQAGNLLGPSLKLFYVPALSKNFRPTFSTGPSSRTLALAGCASGPHRWPESGFAFASPKVKTLIAQIPSHAII